MSIINGIDPDRYSGRILRTVIYDYDAKQRDELSLCRGTIVQVLSMDYNVSGRDDWWTGQIDGHFGIFPSSFVVDRDTITATQPRQIDYNDLVLREVIGEGGFGIAHHAFYHGKDVAVKKPHQGVDVSVSVQHVREEMDLFWTFDHPNIVNLIGVCLEPPNVCLVMEYAHGGPLDRVLAKRKLPADVLLDWAIQVAQGMRYLHTGACHSIIHRDLKSSNGKRSNGLLYTVCKILFGCSFYHGANSRQ